MPAKWAKKWNLPKRWCLRATAADGVSVTLGRYETEEQAEAERKDFAERGKYQHLVVVPIEPKPEEIASEGAQP
jgi:hypothetical protein